MDYSEVAAEFAAVIKELAGKPENLSTLESYLSGHFATWMSMHARTPEDLVEELRMFASMEFEEY